MQETTTTTIAIGPELLKEVRIFEKFLYKVGLKRIEGAIYGLLVLANRPLTSKEIEDILNLSQGAVSCALKSLGHLGAIDTIDTRQQNNNNKKVHMAKENSLSIVASICRKREEQTIEELKFNVEKILKEHPDNDARNERLKSIVSSCDLAESIINFVIALSYLQEKREYQQVIQKLPQILNTLISNKGTINQIRNIASIADKLRTGLAKFAGE